MTDRRPIVNNAGGLQELSGTDTLILPTDPLSALGVATKQYVDNKPGFVDLADSYATTSGETTTPRLTLGLAPGTPVSQTLYLTFFKAKKTETCTNIRTYSATAATATPTVCQLAIFSEDGSGNLTQIAIITNDTTLWAGGSVGYTRSWVTPWSKVAGVRYALGLLVVSGVTLPTLYGLTFPNAAIVGTIMATAPRAYAVVPSQATMPSSVLASSFAASGAPRMTYAELT
jgi:hypothetical protein